MSKKTMTKKITAKYLKELEQASQENIRLKGELKASSKINIVLTKYIADIKTDQNLAEISGLGKDIGSDIAITRIASEYFELKEEIKKLKEENEELQEENEKHKFPNL